VLRYLLLNDPHPHHLKLRTVIIKGSGSLESSPSLDFGCEKLRHHFLEVYAR
jgi:hypothetical protein